MIRFEIYFSDLTPEALARLLEIFNTTEKDENWDMYIIPFS